MVIKRGRDVLLARSLFQFVLIALARSNGSKFLISSLIFVVVVVFIAFCAPSHWMSETATKVNCSTISELERTGEDYLSVSRHVFQLECT